LKVFAELFVKQLVKNNCYLDGISKTISRKVIFQHLLEMH